MKWVIRTKGEWQHCDCTQNQYYSDWSTFTVWGAVGYNWKSPLIILEKGSGPRGGFVKVNYVEQVLRSVVASFFEEQHWAGYTDLIMYEDGNKAHGLTDDLNSAAQVKKELNINFFHVPPSSPDFNIIKNVWRIIKSRLKQRLFTKKEELKQAVLEEWNKLQSHEWMTYFEELPQRLSQCVECQGYATEY